MRPWKNLRLLKMFGLSPGCNFEHDPQCRTIGEPAHLSEERCCKSSAIPSICSSCLWEGAAAPRAFTANMELCEGCRNLRWLSFFPTLWIFSCWSILTMILLPPPIILTCHQAPSVAFRTLHHADLYQTPVQSGRMKTFLCSAGDAPKWKLKYFLTLRVLLPVALMFEVVPRPSRPAWTPFSMLLRGHAALSKHPQLLFVPKLLPGVPSDHGMSLHTDGGDLITVWDTKHSYYNM